MTGIVIAVISTVIGIAIALIIMSSRKKNEKINDENKHPSMAFGLVLAVLMLIFNIVVSILLNYLYCEITYLYLIKRLALITVLWVSAYFDLKSYIIPNGIILTGFALRIIFYVFEFFFERNGLKEAFVEQIITTGALIVGGILCSMILKNGIGMGDVKLFAMMGFYLGFMNSIFTIFVSLVISLIVSAALMIAKKKGRKDEIPFAPSVLVGTLISIIVFGV